LGIGIRAIGATLPCAPGAYSSTWLPKKSAANTSPAASIARPVGEVSIVCDPEIVTDGARLPRAPAGKPRMLGAALELKPPARPGALLT